MIFAEPPRTEYDLNFSVAGIPVRVHPMFWLITLFLGMGGNQRPVPVLLWVGAVFASILVHELGHALAIRHFGWRPWIVLHSFGGLAMHQPTRRDPVAQIIIAFCGPLAGFILAAIVLVAIRSNGLGINVPHYGQIGDPESGIRNPNAALLVWYLLYINIFWGLLNLLPIIPLDGGQISRYAFHLHDPVHGDRRAFLLSTIAAGALAAYALSFSLLMTVFFGYMAYQSYLGLQASRGAHRW